MTRVKRGKIALKRRRNVLRRTKGFHWGGKSKERQAKERLLHAGIHAFHDRRKKKRNFRKLWQIRINAAVRQLAAEKGAPSAGGHPRFPRPKKKKKKLKKAWED